MSPLIIYVMGVSGSGKTTIGAKLSAASGIPFFDADDFHSQRNKEKMRQGIPLTDEDRQEWLAALHHLALVESAKKGAIIACSALKQKYRVLLSERIQVPVRWLFLQGDYELISERMKRRKHDFMPERLLHSQFDALEIPVNAIRVDISKTPEEIVAALMRQLDLPQQ